MWRLRKENTEMKWEHWTKRWNWSSCADLAVRVSWTHGLIAQLVRASERNSVVVSSDPTQANFLQLLLKIFLWWIPYVYMYIYFYRYFFSVYYHHKILEGKKEKYFVPLLLTEIKYQAVLFHFIIFCSVPNESLIFILRGIFISFTSFFFSIWHIRSNGLIF